MRSIFAIIFLCAFASDIRASEPAKVDFAKDVSPILSDRCFICHGPDTEQRASDLRLDVPESALELAVVPHKPDESELIARIFATDSDVVMPPPESKLSLSDREKNVLRAWIEQGAEFATHWAFTPPELPEPPEVENIGWIQNDIDRFVLRKLEEEGLAPSSPADRATWIRRLTLDLTGLPPSVEAVDEFMANENPNAYEELVDHLLASQAFGERMAVDWLDAARYADTHGYQSDRYRAMWPWRDWVIQAFNENLPYDQFISWQIAGDLLPNPSRQQILATAFNRNHRQTNEGGSVEEEYRAEYVADRVNTFGTAFLGLTLECCRCHDHKYDPITQRDYYSLSAFFNSIDESGLYSHFTSDTPTPALTLSEGDQEANTSELTSQIREAEMEFASCQVTDEQFAQWRATFADVRPQSFLTDSTPTGSLRKSIENSLSKGLLADYSFDALEEGKLVNRVTGMADGKTSEDPEVVRAKVGNGLRLSGENNATFAAGGDFTRDEEFTLSLWIKSPKEFERAVIFHRSRAWTDAASRGYELLIEDGRLSAALIHFWPGNAMRIMATETLALNKWTHVTLAYDGSSRVAGLELYVNGEKVNVEIVRDKLTREIQGSEATELTIGQRFRDVGFKDGEVDELRVYERKLSALEIKLLELRDSAPANIAEYLHNVSDQELRGYCLDEIPTVAGKREELRKRLASLRTERSQLVDSIPEIMVMLEDPEPRPTYVLVRGAYDAPGEAVTRDIPQNIFAREFDNPPNRLDLAEWLTDPRNPLTARVAVNRFWQSLFGTGIVATSEDFGLQGANPTHPELLDWLAYTFVDSGWDVKRLLKTIVMSATYRQQSNPSARLLELDPENRWFARGPSARLSAEMIRDSALSASRLLVDKVGGPPVKPYQPPGLWEEKSGEAYNRDKGEGSRRRSLYTFWKRTSPPPSMMTFDASNREVCIVNRQNTMTPLQVLVLLNDPQLVEASVALAEVAMTESDDVERRLQTIFRSLCSRVASEPELVVLKQIMDEQRVPFAADEQLAKNLVSAGDHVPSPDLDVVELAALTVVAEGLMSYDEFIMKR